MRPVYDPFFEAYISHYLWDIIYYLMRWSKSFLRERYVVSSSRDHCCATYTCHEMLSRLLILESLIFQSCFFLSFFRQMSYVLLLFFFKIYATQKKYLKCITDLTCRTTTIPSARVLGTVRVCTTWCLACWTIILFPGSGPSVPDTMSPNFSSESVVNWQMTRL